MRNDFACFIFSHGRSKNVSTLPLLRKIGYSGKIYIICDDEDDEIEEYKKLDSDGVIIFNKSSYMEWVDSCDNFDEHRALLYGRNAGYDIAKELGLKYFVQLDDDYKEIKWRIPDYKNHKLLSLNIKNLDRVFEAYIDFLEVSGAYAIAFAQGGDFIGGIENENVRKGLGRKCMNSWICKTDRRIYFLATMNDDVCTYVLRSQIGQLFFTEFSTCIKPAQTQKEKGGMTEIYLDRGTYQKSFYTVITSPSCCTIAMMGESHQRIHHSIDWNCCAPKILSPKYKKGA